MALNDESGQISFTGQFANEGGLEILTTKFGDSLGVKLHATQGRVMGTNCTGGMYFERGKRPKSRAARTGPKKKKGEHESKFEVSTPLFGATNHYAALVAVCAAGMLLATSAFAAVRWRRSGAAAPSLLARDPIHEVEVE